VLAIDQIRPGNSDGHLYHANKVFGVALNYLWVNGLVAGVF
jgi:hypothetical protein